MITPRNKVVATFDVGSNTVLVTIAKLKQQACHPREDGDPDLYINILHDAGEVCRLSEGLTLGGLLKAEAKQRVLNCLQKFKKICDKYVVDEIFAVGTAAFRKANDGATFAKQINEELGIPLKIISGEEEARLSYLSTQQDFGRENKKQKIGMIDIGGASTEVVAGELNNRVSIPIGSVALTEQFVKNHPICDSEWEALQKNIQSQIVGVGAPHPQHSMLWIAVAATATSLKAIDLQMETYDGTKIHGTTLTQARITELASSLRHMSIEARQKISGMHPKRADVLPTGALILSELMLQLNITEITISDHGLRHGLLWNH